LIFCHFYLAIGGDTGARLAAAGSLTEAVMNMLGRRISSGATGASGPKLEGTTFEPRDYTAELSARGYKL